MKISIQTKLLVMCSALVLLTILGISTTYYMLTKRDKQREFQDRIQVAFDFFLDAYTDRRSYYVQRVDEFVRKNRTMSSSLYFYQQDASEDTLSGITAYLSKVAGELRQLGQILVPDRVLIYGKENRLLALYSRQGGDEQVGGVITLDDGRSTFFPLTSEVLGKMVSRDFVLPDLPLPITVEQEYVGEFPEGIVSEIITHDTRLGIRVLTPLYSLKQQVGLLVSDMFFDQDFVERYASLSQTDINLFAGEQFSVGTLAAQERIDSADNAACEAVHSQAKHITLSSSQLGEQQYYLGQCEFRNAQEYVGTLSVSLARDIEEHAIMQIARSILLVSGVSLLATFAMSVLLSRRSIHSLRKSVNVITAVSEGDLRQKATPDAHDEIGRVARKLNQMIDQLRVISNQVQQASYHVNQVADTILKEMDELIGHIEKESSLIDNTTESTQKIKTFIDMVARNSSELLLGAAQILSSIQESRASISEVNTSTGQLTENLLRISASIGQVKQSTRQISDNTGQLEDVAQHTEQEIDHIERTLKDVLHNAERTQELAQETMQAATSGQSSVEASIQGMQELKDVVVNSAQIIREVNSWGERVSSILDIVDEITEQTSLLSLNASIISAQAGVHGRGFAVVADEIKELAIRTKHSTKEIGTLVRELQKKSEEGVANTEEGIKKADQGVCLASAVKDALSTILESATRSSNRASDTARLVQQTTACGQSINRQMTDVTQMVSTIRSAFREEAEDIEAVIVAVENISGMAEQVNRATLEQRRAAEDIDQKMSNITDQFENISEQTEILQHNSDQIVEAMRAIEATSEHILQNTTEISGESVRHLIQQAESLQKVVQIFKVS